MGGRQRGKSVEYATSPHTETPNESTGLERLWVPEESGKEFEFYKNK
ncbi:MAG: hypothetical protein GTN36_00890 [Candidatus Aenigmarchaeota archaeon]|nr:hypothetical protein [Candidatus Aenigmarchaeota archaeon]